MNNLVIDNDKFKVYAPSTLKFYTDKLEEILEDRLKFYCELLDCKDYRKVTINLFDDIEEFRNFIYDLRKERESLPKYAAGTFDNGMINLYMNKLVIEGTPLYYETLRVIPHELFHIMYQEEVLDKYKIKRITWIDEGMAQYFSEEKKDLLYEDNFDNFLNGIIDSTKKIPDLNKLEHGTSFVCDEYDAYDLSLIVVKYLYENMEKSEFKSLITSTDKIIEIGNKMTDELSKYFKNNRKKMC